jgi:hypothetical protein
MNRTAAWAKLTKQTMNNNPFNTNNPLTPIHRSPISVQFKDTVAVKCECGCAVFEEKIVMRKISALLVGAGQPDRKIIPVPVCAKCNKVLLEVLPEELKEFLKEHNE